MIRGVLLGIGGTPFTKVAIRRAVELCRLHNARLTAVTVVDTARLSRVGARPLGASGAALALREHRVAVTRESIEESIELLKGTCAEHGVQVSIQRETGNPFQLMVDYARYNDVGLFGLRSMFEYDLLGESDVDVADLLSRMVLGGVRPIVADADHYREIRRVLIAYGGSTRAAESMKTFLRLKPWPDADVRILCCSDSRGDARRLLSSAAGYCRLHGVEPQVHWAEGPARERILAEADAWDADLIVMGTSRGSVFSRALFGTTALEVIRRADRALFLGR